MQNVAQSPDKRPYNSPERRLSALRRLQTIAAERGGRLISEAYLGEKIRHTWQCGCGHQWQQTPRVIVERKRWCPECGRARGLAKVRKTADERRLGMAEMCRIAHERGGLCLSTVYTNLETKLTWQCAKGHQWSAPPCRIIQSKSWCPKCATQRMPRFTISDMQQVAAQRGGKCLSTSFDDRNTPLRWECKKGHQWTSQASNIRRGNWCPRCAKLPLAHGEKLARSILEAMFNAPFPKMRPKWLVGLKSRPLELDGYNETLAIAFEYQGLQHYEPSTHYPADRVAAQQLRDEHKARMCHAKGVRLIVIPQFTDIKNRQACQQQVEFAALWAGLVPPKRVVRRTNGSVLR